MIKISFRNVSVNKILKNIQNKEDKFYKSVKEEFIRSAIRMEINAKRTIIRNDNIITGNLLNSIYSRIKESRKNGKFSGIEIVVGARMHYAIYVERRFPFLFPSFESEKPVLMRNLKNIK